MLGLAAVATLGQAAMVLGFGVYSWEVMLLLFASGVPGLWLLVMGDPPDPETGMVSKPRRAGLVASFVAAVVLAMVSSGILVHGLGIELW